MHRDVKPGNLLRSREGVVKLADFGIAKAAEQSDITKVGSVLGTAAYLAPEQARGEPAGPASDLYALGVVSYQLLAGRLPYEAASLTDLARLQETGPPPRPTRSTPTCRRALAEAVARALHPLPERRYEDALEMGDALATGCAGSRRTRPTRRSRSTRRGDAHARRRRPPPPAATGTSPARPSAPAGRWSRSTSRRAGARPRRPRARPPRDGRCAARASAATRSAASSAADRCSRVVVVGVVAYQAAAGQLEPGRPAAQNVRGTCRTRSTRSRT